PLFRTRHRVIGACGPAARRTGARLSRRRVCGALGVSALIPAALPGRLLRRLVAGVAVVLIQGVLLAAADVLVVVDVGGVLDRVLRHGQPDVVAVELRSGDGREALPGAEQAGVHRDPERLAGLIVAVDLADLSHLDSP